MKRDTIKTLAGLLIIGVIVVATFLYGNAQRQAQLRHEQDAKKQQEAANQSKSPSASPSASASPSPTGSPSQATAPVKSPAASTLQGAGGSGQSGQVAGSQTTPAAGASGGAQGLPETGSPVVGMLGITAMGIMWLALRRSRKAVVDAARGRR